MVRGDQCKVFYKPFYTRNDFSDERYSPVFSPTAYPGQTVSMKLYLDQWEGWETLGLRHTYIPFTGKRILLQGYIKLVQEQWISVEFTIPDVEGDIVDEVGIVIEGYSLPRKKSRFDLPGRLCDNRTFGVYDRHKKQKRNLAVSRRLPPTMEPGIRMAKP